MKKTEYIFSGICISVLALFFLSISLVAFTRVVLLDRLGIENCFTDRLLSLTDFNKSRANSNLKSVAVDWSLPYPFSKNIGSNDSNNANRPLTRVLSLFQGVKEGFEGYASEHLAGRNDFSALERFYKKTILWNYSSSRNRNSSIRTLDGYLAFPSYLVDVKEDAESLSELSKFCEKHDVVSLYLNVPVKICKYDDRDIDNIISLDNRNADSFLSLCDSLGVENYDLREFIHEDQYSHHELFYKTDHHWRLETGRWAAQRIIAILNDNHGFHFDLSRLDSKFFYDVVYPDQFYGSGGKRSLIPTEPPEDYVLTYPTYQTEFHYEIKSLEIDKIGDFPIFYDLENALPNGSFNVIYGNQALERIENTKTDNQNHVLIVHDSFGNAVVPFFALCCRRLDSIDLRSFNGSLQNFIETEKPDVVIVMYNSDAFNFETRSVLYDFR